MKRFELQIKAEGIAFENAEDGTGDEQRRIELARILRRVAERLEGGDHVDIHRNIHNQNGNIVGTFVLKESH